MKTIKTYEATSFAIEVMRTAIEIQLGRQIRLGEYDTSIRPRHFKEDDGRRWESRHQAMAGNILTADGTDMYSFVARIELSSYRGVWRSARVFFELTQNEQLVRYIAHSQYRNNPPPGLKVEYPDFMNSTTENAPLSNSDKWRVGKSFCDVRNFSDFEWHPIMNTYVHP